MCHLMLECFKKKKASNSLFMQVRMHLFQGRYKQCGLINVPSTSHFFYPQEMSVFSPVPHRWCNLSFPFQLGLWKGQKLSLPLYSLQCPAYVKHRIISNTPSSHYFLQLESIIITMNMDTMNTEAANGGSLFLERNVRLDSSECQ